MRAHATDPAIFYATGNGLQAIKARIGRSELHERLPSKFTFRKVSKSGTPAVTRRHR